MNWSMKISNYNPNNKTTNNTHNKNHHLSINRSSKSPSSNHSLQQCSFPRSNSSFSKFYNQSNDLEDSVLNLLSPPVEFRNKHNQQINKSLKPNNKSTTSWGKLKHSKSSSSNIGCSIEEG